MAERDTTSKNVGDELDPEQEKQIIECNDGDDEMHPDFSQLNPDDFQFENNLTQSKKILR